MHIIQVFFVNLNCVSFAVAILTRQVVIDPSTGFATNGDGSVIMKTAPALKVKNDAIIHHLSTTELSVMNKIIFGISFTLIMCFISDNDRGSKEANDWCLFSIIGMAQTVYRSRSDTRYRKPICIKCQKYVLCGRYRSVGRSQNRFALNRVITKCKL